jgi:protein-S-isoprenylcysteine O-methyltransferase Ste14
MWGNWVSLATLTVLLLVFIIWRIRAEEKAPPATLDGRYRPCASQHKRPVPLVW